jgi:hypothetical protein
LFDFKFEKSCNVGFLDFIMCSSGTSFTPPSSIVFSGSADDEKLSGIHDSFLVAINFSSSIYFQNVNRLRSKTSDLFGAVILEDFDEVVYRVSSMHGSGRIEYECIWVGCDAFLLHIGVLRDFNLPKPRLMVQEIVLHCSQRTLQLILRET